MSNTGRWIAGGVLGLTALLGLFLASRAADEEFYFLGWFLFISGVVLIFVLIKRSHDLLDQAAAAVTEVEAEQPVEEKQHGTAE
ncbi:MAG TPA: hypothetical protein VEB64_15800 [Azospirillaceae bacterium]|nr:hypothetical protein [Azospirillaceae bacterium]